MTALLCAASFVPSDFFFCGLVALLFPSLFVTIHCLLRWIWSMFAEAQCPAPAAHAPPAAGAPFELSCETVASKCSIPGLKLRYYVVVRELCVDSGLCKHHGVLLQQPPCVPRGRCLCQAGPSCCLKSSKLVGHRPDIFSRANLLV